MSNQHAMKARKVTEGSSTRTYSATDETEQSRSDRLHQVPIGWEKLSCGPTVGLDVVEKSLCTSPTERRSSKCR
jgi:hypothetical protein